MHIIFFYISHCSVCFINTIAYVESNFQVFGKCYSKIVFLSHSPKQLTMVYTYSILKLRFMKFKWCNFRYQRSINIYISEIVGECDQEIPQSQTADNPVAPRGRAAQPSGDTRKTN